MASSPREEVVQQGWLNKKGGGKRRANWNRRFFVLSPTKLEYYTDEKLTCSKGIVPIDGGLLTFNVVPFSEKKHAFVMALPNRDFVMQAANDGEMNGWIRILLETYTKRRKEIEDEGKKNNQPKLCLPSGCEVSQKMIEAQTRFEELHRFDGARVRKEGMVKKISDKEGATKPLSHKKQGMLGKGEIVKHRYCVLTLYELTIFENSEKTTIEGNIDLRLVQDIVAAPDPKNLLICLPTQRYTITTASDREREEWIDELKETVAILAEKEGHDPPPKKKTQPTLPPLPPNLPPNPKQWKGDEVATWARSVPDLGEKVARAFEENHISGPDLFELSHEEIKNNLGIDGEAGEFLLPLLRLLCQPSPPPPSPPRSASLSLLPLPPPSHGPPSPRSPSGRISPQVPPLPPPISPVPPTPLPLPTSRSASLWSPEEVGEWLAKVGVGGLSGQFVENQISGKDLVELTEEDLRGDLGVEDDSQISLLLGKIRRLQESPPPPSSPLPPLIKPPLPSSHGSWSSISPRPVSPRGASLPGSSRGGSPTPKRSLSGSPTPRSAAATSPRGLSLPGSSRGGSPTPKRSFSGSPRAFSPPATRGSFAPESPTKGPDGSSRGLSLPGLSPRGHSPGSSRGSAPTKVAPLGDNSPGSRGSAVTSEPPTRASEWSSRLSLPGPPPRESSPRGSSSSSAIVSESPTKGAEGSPRGLSLPGLSPRGLSPGSSRGSAVVSESPPKGAEGSPGLSLPASSRGVSLPGSPKNSRREEEKSTILSTPPDQWSIGNVGEWLEAIGAKTAIASFSENMVTGIDLLELTAEEIRDDLEIEDDEVESMILKGIEALKKGNFVPPAPPCAEKTETGDEETNESSELPEGWKHYVDPKGRKYYYNKATRQKQWNKPATGANVPSRKSTKGLLFSWNTSEVVAFLEEKGLPPKFIQVVKQEEWGGTKLVSATKADLLSFMEEGEEGEKAVEKLLAGIHDLLGKYGQKYVVLWGFEANSSSKLSVSAGMTVYGVEDVDEEWIKVRDQKGGVGRVPFRYLRIVEKTAPTSNRPTITTRTLSRGRGGGGRAPTTKM